MELLGLPPRSMLEAASRRKMFFDKDCNPRIVPNSRGKRRRPGSRDLASVMHTSDKLFISFLQGCLAWDKNSRLTPEQALQHPWLAESVSAPAGSQVLPLSLSLSLSLFLSLAPSPRFLSFRVPLRLACIACALRQVQK